MYHRGMIKSVRRERLQELLQARGAVAVTDLAEALDVSVATARRDVIALEEQGVVTRTWGGVQLAGTVDDPFQETLARGGAAKQRIGQAAAAMVEDGMTVILDIGTTVHYAALALSGRSITVLTPSLPTFEVLRGHANVELILLGGVWSERYQCFDGLPVVDALARQQADVAFLGCSGVSETGRVRDTSYGQSAIKRAMRTCAARVHLLADREKFPGQGSASPFDLGAIDGLVTDHDNLSPDLVARCRETNTEIHTV